MSNFTSEGHQNDVPATASGYRPPTVTYLGDLADLTQKTVGGIDGSTFLGLDIGSV